MDWKQYTLLSFSLIFLINLLISVIKRKEKKKKKMEDNLSICMVKKNIMLSNFDSVELKCHFRVKLLVFAFFFSKAIFFSLHHNHQFMNSFLFEMLYNFFVLKGDIYGIEDNFLLYFLYLMALTMLFGKYT